MISGRLSVLLLCSAGAAQAAICIVGASGAAFGNYSAVAPANLDTTATVTVTCTTAIPTALSYVVQLSTGVANSFSRRMTFGLASLNYNLYVDAARSIIWGDGSSGTSQQSFSGSIPLGLTVHNYTVYGRAPSGQIAITGLYVDVIIVTVNY